MWTNLHTCIWVILHLLITKSKSKLKNHKWFSPAQNVLPKHLQMFNKHQSERFTYAVNFPSFALPTFSAYSVFLWIYLSSDLFSRSCMKRLLQIVCVWNVPICFDWTSTSILMFFPAVIWNWPSILILKTCISTPVLATHLHAHFRRNKSKRYMYGQN